MIYKVVLILIVSATIMSCSENCIRCENETTSEFFEACEDDEVFFTDGNGNNIPFEAIPEAWGTLGFECN